MKMARLALVAVSLVWGCDRASASLIVDSFTEGGFMLSLDGVTGTGSTLSGPLGTLRFSRISDRLAADGSVLSSTLSTAVGTLSFDVDGQSAFAEVPLDLTLSYSEGGPFSVREYDAFEFDFTSVAGSGFLIVELGSQSDSYGPETHRIALTSPGMVTVPFDSLNFGSTGSIDLFNVWHVRFEAETTQFSFTLEEIRLVPEPSTLDCIFLGTAGLLVAARIRLGAWSP